MKRSKFLLLSGLGIAAVAVPTWYFGFYKLTSEQLLAQPQLLSHIWNASEIGQIGRLYREQFANENSEAALLAHLSPFESENTTVTLDQLQQQITNDYQQEKTVLLDGWILSRTEARQCALYSLKQNK
jgi:hypothetical protein